MPSFRLAAVDDLPDDAPVVSVHGAGERWLLSHDRGWQIGLVQVGATRRPPETLEASSGRLFVGLYPGLALVLDPGTGKEVGRLQMDLGGRISFEEYDEIVLAVGDTHAAVFRPDGKRLWDASTMDVIEASDVVDGVVILRDMSDHTYRFDAKTGRKA